MNNWERYPASKVKETARLERHILKAAEGKTASRSKETAKSARDAHRRGGIQVNTIHVAGVAGIVQRQAVVATAYLQFRR